MMCKRTAVVRRTEVDRLSSRRRTTYVDALCEPPIMDVYK
jgi:hypothetical protein